MNKIMGDAIVNQDNYFQLLIYLINLRVWGVKIPVKAFREINGSTFDGSEGGLGSLTWGSASKGETSPSS
jgi:hypothetical protein